MKRYFSLIGAGLLMAGIMTACGGDGSSASTGDGALAGASQGDSLMYYFGQTRAAEFWEQAARDTTLADEAARKDFMRGVRAGLDAIKGSDAYNMGVFQGVQLALNLKDFQKDFPGVRLNNDIMLRAMADGLKSDSTFDPAEAQKALYAIIGRLEEQKAALDRAASVEALPAQAKTLGMTKISDQLYSKILTEGNGTKFNPGDTVTTAMTLTTVDGRTLRVPLPSEVVIGRRYVSALVSEALSTMTQNGAGRFLTSAYAMFGQRCERLDLKPSEPLILTIRTGSAIGDKSGSESPKETKGVPAVKQGFSEPH